MFKVIHRPEFTHDVLIRVPTDDGHVEEALRTRFRAMPDDEQKKFDLGDPEQLKDFLRQVVVRFEDLADEDGQALSYSEDIRDQLLGKSFVRIGLLAGYTRAMAGARAGN